MFSAFCSGRSPPSIDVLFYGDLSVSAVITQSNGLILPFLESILFDLLDPNSGGIALALAETDIGFQHLGEFKFQNAAQGFFIIPSADSPEWLEAAGQCRPPAEVLSPASCRRRCHRPPQF